LGFKVSLYRDKHRAFIFGSLLGGAAALPVETNLIVTVFFNQRLRLVDDFRQIGERLRRHRIEGKHCKEADDGEHNETDGLLAIVSAMREAHPCAREDKDAAHPPNRRTFARRLIQMLVADGSAQAKIGRP
jgi:hypothetical protein